jgi:hypothetical protein
MRQAAASRLLLTAFALAASACGGKAIKLPTDPGTPLSDYAAIHRQLSTGCADVRTLRTEGSLSGNANGNGLRGSLAAGFRSPADMRLELRVGPLRTPVFYLAANAGGATLLLPRDKQVVRTARGEDLLAALTGIALSPSDLMAILTGCVVPSPNPTGGHQHAGGWGSIDLAGGATLYAQRAADHWQLRAARRGNWRIDYVEWPSASRFPSRVVLTSVMPVAVDLRVTLGESEANVDLGDEVFVVSVPADTEVISLERLRQSGPLRDR